MVNPQLRDILLDIAYPPLLTQDHREQLFYEELPESRWRNPKDPNGGFPATTQGCIVKRHVDHIFATFFREAELIDRPSLAAQNLWRVFNYCNLACNSKRTNQGKNPSRLIRGNSYDNANFNYLQWMDRHEIPIGLLPEPPYLLEVAGSLVPGIVQLCLSRSLDHGRQGQAPPEPRTWGTPFPSSERAFYDMKWLRQQ
jgi:hypothetical protein